MVQPCLFTVLKSLCTWLEDMGNETRPQQCRNDYGNYLILSPEDLGTVLECSQVCWTGPQ